MDDMRLVFFGVEITPAEAVQLLSEGAIMAALVAGYSQQNGNWKTIQRMAREYQQTLLRFHQEPGRRHVHCVTCGAVREPDDGVLPEGDATYALVATPLPDVVENPVGASSTGDKRP